MANLLLPVFWSHWDCIKPLKLNPIVSRLVDFQGTKQAASKSKDGAGDSTDNDVSMF